MVAHHRGIFGLGLLLTVGMIASLVSALAVLPVLLQSWQAQPNRGNILMPIPRRS
jgi:predicted RND superfamily exporter protein